MAVPVIMPRQGNTVESCVINEFKKKPGDKASTSFVEVIENVKNE